MTIQAQLRATTTGAFEWPLISASVAVTCDRCNHTGVAEFPALCDWRSRIDSANQRRAADGHPCTKCGHLIPPPTPLLQYRRGDVIGLAIGFPAMSDPTDDKRFITDTLIAADRLELIGANVVVSARMSWWGSIYKTPLGPHLIAGAPLRLPESEEEVERWTQSTLDALKFPAVEQALAER